MERNSVFSRRRRSDKMDGIDHFPSSDSDQVHVLAVDDSLVDRKLIERLLRLTACRVTAVDSGIGALQYLGLGLNDENNSPVEFDGLKVDMIITDYCMPGMTGYELLKKIKESSTLREIPVVIMSSENVMTRIDRCLEEGAEDFLVKPVKLSDVKRLREYMKGDEKPETDINKTNKRKLRDPSCEVASLSPSISSPESSAMSSTPSSSEDSEPSSPTSTLQSDDSKLQSLH